MGLRKNAKGDSPAKSKKSKGKNKGAAGVVGLDLDPSHIAAAEVFVNGSVSVTRGAVAMLRPGVLRDGEVADAPALTEALRAFFEEHDLPSRVRLGVANQRIVVRMLDLPPLEDEKALAAAVRVEAPDQIPMPIEEAVLDYQPLGIVDTPAGPRARVLVVAVRREMIERLVTAAQEAGLEVEGVDLAAFGMVRALAPSPDEGAVLYVNASGLTNVAVANHTGTLFTRAAAGGVDAMTATLSERRGLTLEHARQWLAHVGLETPVAEIEGDPEVIAAARAVLEDGVHQLADAARNSLNFFRMQDGAEPVERAVLVGPAAGIPGFVEKLSEQLHLPMAAADVFGAAAVAGEAEPHRLTVAAGLAVNQSI
jgi:type IV pilus assembly protein PilM